ncbi:MAG: xanthine dehydrogenase family protein [Thermomicrobiales bacterium]|nr:xanthine dehydrogenase family protein [Thermomicrobiales bacterium]
MTATTCTTELGNRGRRLDADDKVTGRARYASDLHPPGVLFGKIVRSDRPHAHIIRIDTHGAESLPGVEAVVTAADASGHFGEVVKDQTVFASDRVRHIGEPVAAIAAESEAIADLAARLIEIDYHDLPALFDPIAALQPDAPLIHDDVAAYVAPEQLIRWGNVCSQVVLAHGDIADAFARADRIIEGTYQAHSVHQAPMEPRAVVVEADARGRLTVHASTQHPFGVRHQLHEALDIPYADIRVVTEAVGGGFGAKLEASVEIYAAVLARKTGRPIRVVNSREEDLAYGNPRHPMLIHMRSAVANDGAMLGREVKIIMDAGAYAGASPALTDAAAVLVLGPYRIPAVKVEVLAVHTNKMPFGAFRGPTGPQTVFAVEAHTDAIARELNIDRLALRLKNASEEGDLAHNGQALRGVSLRDVLTRAAAAIDWGTVNPPSAPGLQRGKGLACSWWLTTPGASGCGVQLNDDGTVVVQTGAAEIGTGAVMAGVAQIVATELGVPLEHVRVVWGDTDATPLDAGAQGSRTLYNAGHAARQAAVEARVELLRRAADILEAAEGDLEVRDGKVMVRGVPDRHVSYADLMAGQMWTSGPVMGRGSYLADPTPYLPERLEGSLSPTFNAPSFHCHAAEVEVDPETGQTRVVDFVVAQDVGFAINPTYVEGQMQGGAVQGIGYALSEELVIENGQLLNPNLALYKLPTALEAPTVRTIIVEHPSEQGPYGAKGVGEPPVIVSAAAVAAALTDAIGVPIRTTPFTPERVHRAIRHGEAAVAPQTPPGFDVRPGDVRIGAGPAGSQFTRSRRDDR